MRIINQNEYQIIDIRTRFRKYKLEAPTQFIQQSDVHMFKMIAPLIIMESPETPRTPRHACITEEFKVGPQSSLN